MKNLKKLSREDLKSISGGKLAPESGCATICPNGSTISIGCTAGCSVSNGAWVGCDGPDNSTVMCG
ncbi:hypothetical protein QGN23_01330 [Chryseobacterium gotjawalense]|uniref:Bacteriocin n=1 Tax=Chryseobacterium gotjawalense TaxID=3042315 RepID=A0ABY8RE06_9FLAO|nr:hypothetical protein [Chryseobacterium sp. wdc7]WHF51934.1 hypothetical protein QGN23_01330 [Chryseobacterium sp. wdc7]